MSALVGHRDHLAATADGARRAKMRAEAELREAVREQIESRVLRALAEHPSYADWVQEIQQGVRSAQSIAEAALDSGGPRLKN